MRLTTRTAAIAVAGLAALATGCSSGSSAAPAPVVHHKPVVQQVAAKAKPLTAKQQLAAAMRATLAEHTALFRERWSVVPVKPSETFENINPYKTIAGWADFDKNRYVEHLVRAPHAAQPTFPGATGLSDGQSFFQGNTTNLVNSGTWAKSSLTTCGNIDVLVDVLSNTTGTIAVQRFVRMHYTKYTLKVDLGRQLMDSCDAATRAQGRSMLGQLATQYVWVNSDNQIFLQKIVVPTGSVSALGYNASVVKNVAMTIELNGFGVKPVIPPHPTA
ncbi:MAG: hypothetical protein QOG53_627 [Frankiales bacterium]|jgi:hypothetical protein|nr:hypothetical protein [Frankiales bacterium]